jgi:hypothetical protein
MTTAPPQHANGRGRPVTLAPLPVHGPVSGWPQQDDTGHGRTARDRPEPSRTVRGAVDGDTVIRVLAAVAVLAVAAFAAIVSYSHIFELGRHHGQDGTAARLLPLSVDGLIAAASLVMLHAARRKLDVPWLARAMLALGVGATVAANVGYGLPSGWLSAVVSAWPAVAFVGSAEMAVRFARDARQPAPAVTGSGTSDRTKAVTKAVTEPPLASAKTGTEPGTGRRAADVIKRHPGWTDEEVIKHVGCHPRTVQRARRDITGSMK